MSTPQLVSSWSADTPANNAEPTSTTTTTTPTNTPAPSEASSRDTHARERTQICQHRALTPQHAPSRPQTHTDPNAMSFYVPDQQHYETWTCPQHGRFWGAPTHTSGTLYTVQNTPAPSSYNSLPPVCTHVRATPQQSPFTGTLPPPRLYTDAKQPRLYTTPGHPRRRP